MFVHEKVLGDVFTGKHVLDIGCGRNKLAGAIGLDQSAFAEVDIVANLEEPLPIRDNEFDVVFANQVLEHVRNLTALLLEVHRILRPGGRLLAHVLYFR